MRIPKALVRGGGDIATGTIHRLVKSGFRVLVTEIETPTVIRLNVAAASAIYEGDFVVEGVTYINIKNSSEVDDVQETGSVPVLVDPQMNILETYQPDLIVDAVLAKRNLGTTVDMAPVVIALGPGFEAGVDCDAVIETARGHDLGRIFYHGKASEDTGVPGNILGYAEERILRSTGVGPVVLNKRIGDHVEAHELIGTTGGIPFYSNIGGVIRGLINEAVSVKKGMKIGDVDPRDDYEACNTISDKARALGGAVLEAYLQTIGGLRI